MASMKIKKPMSAPAPQGTGGAAIADRFKLDAVASGAAYKGPTTGKAAAISALVAGLIALVIAGTLTFIIYQHWDYLMPA